MPYEPYFWPDGVQTTAAFTVDVDATAPYLWTTRDGTPQLGQLEQRRFGPRVGLWRLVELIEQLGIRGSFYVPGAVAETWPDILPTLAGRGHEVGLHGWFHEIVQESDDGEFAAALDRSIALFERQTGQRPRGFRSPAWEMTPGMLRRLAEAGLAYDSSLMGFDHPYEIDGVVELPVQWLVDDAIYFKFNGDGSDKWHPAGSRQVLESWQDEFHAMHERGGGLFMITVHDWISGRGQRLLLLRRLIETIGKAGDVRWARLCDIADGHRASANAGRHAVRSDLPAPIGPQRLRPA
jgi:peptidoglycan/xylan/chitin deacetylase (PgdA/CDA1 family)